MPWRVYGFGFRLFRQNKLTDKKRFRYMSADVFPYTFYFITFIFLFIDVSVLVFIKSLLHLVSRFKHLLIFRNIALCAEFTKLYFLLLTNDARNVHYLWKQLAVQLFRAILKDQNLNLKSSQSFSNFKYIINITLNLLLYKITF